MAKFVFSVGRNLLPVSGTLEISGGNPCVPHSRSEEMKANRLKKFRTSAPDI